MIRLLQVKLLAALLGIGLLTLSAVACGADAKLPPSPIPAVPTVAVTQAATAADSVTTRESGQPDTSATAVSPVNAEAFDGPPTLFKLPRAGGGEVSLGALIGTQPVVVVFYRGFF